VTTTDLYPGIVKIDTTVRRTGIRANSLYDIVFDMDVPAMLDGNAILNGQTFYADAKVA
jgi:hypothetical protein